MTATKLTPTPAEAVEQGSDEWHAARLGKITASRFSDVLTQPRSKADKEAGKLSATAKSYMLDVIAEMLTGEPQGFEGNAATRWGNEAEPDARIIYAELTGNEVTQVGFLSHPDEPTVGGSPDGLIGDEGGIEIKCPLNTRIHLQYMLDGVLPRMYAAQVHGLLWITGRQWWDFVSCDPRMDDLSLAMFRVRVERDEEEIKRLETAVLRFRDALLETLCTLKGGIKT